jgi:hypothetical protein
MSGPGLPAQGNWTAISTMTDGSKVAVLDASTQNLLISNDSGATWQADTSEIAWTAVSYSADGAHLLAAGTASGVNMIHAVQPVAAATSPWSRRRRTNSHKLQAQPMARP